MSCSKCKKKKPVENLEPIIEPKEIIGFIPSHEDIVLAYSELSSYGGVREEKKEFINNVYKHFFNEDFNFSCGGCASSQARKFKNLINDELKLNL